MKTTNLFALMLLLASASITVPAAVTDGLVGHWTFDETSGATAKDSSGKGNNATVGNNTGDNPQWGTGKIGGALTFRGPDNGGDYAIVAQVPALTTTFSVSGWVLADPRDGTWPQSTIIESGLGSGGPLGLVIRLKNRDQAFGPLGDTSTDANGQLNLSESVGFPTASWQHVGVVADGTKIRLYRNGVEVAATNYSGTLPSPAGTALGIGVTLDDTAAPSTGYWQGQIDDVGLWTNALTASQVASIYNAGQAGKDLSAADQYQNAPPTISVQPSSQTRFVGEIVSFAVTAAGTAPLSYQWKLNGTAIPGATNATYTISNVKTSDAGPYTVKVTNPGGSVESQPATLTVKAATLSTGLVGYWKLDEKKGLTAADSSPSNDAGTLFNFLGDDSQWTAGQIGGALLLGGPDTQQYVIVADFPKPTNTITVSLWAYANSLPTWGSFVKNWGGAVAGQFHFGLFADGGQENIYIKQADGKTPNVSDTVLFPLNSWQHVAFVCDGSKVRLYRNGAEVANTDYDGTLVPAPISALGIGAKLSDDGTVADSGNPGYWDGKLDDIAIWNRGLSPNEMQAIYNAGLAGKGALEANPDQSVAPSITVQPTGANVFEGSTVTLTVTAAGTPPLLYQWLKDGTPILNGTNNSLSLTSVALSAAGKYKVTVSNSVGSATSTEAAVVVQKRPPATLVSEWKFEGNLRDTSGNGNDGTAGGSVQYVAGISGQAVRLAPGNPIANAAAQNLPALGTDSWSLNLWMNLTAQPTSLAYLAGFGPVKDVGTGTARALLAFTGPKNNNIYAWGSNRDTATDTPYPVARWAMITITHDGTDGTTTLFLDGQQIGQNIQPRVDIPEGNNFISLAPTSNWNIDVGGDFDEFTLWKGVLNVDQLQQLASVGAVALSISLNASQIVISWPDAATGYTLESSSTLPASSWTAVPGVQGNTATISPAAKAQFFRLRK